VDMLNVHCLGGHEMMQRAVESVQSVQGANATSPLLIGVTVLTSHTPEAFSRDALIHTPLPQVVTHLAQQAQSAGLHGVVCSPEEITPLRAALGSAFVLVTPGIRPAGSTTGDQQRIATPAAAIKAGASFLVVGRPIIEAPNPVQAARNILAEMAQA
jgi:orotidine-5'-phosphate decarboxylase